MKALFIDCDYPAGFAERRRARMEFRMECAQAPVIGLDSCTDDVQLLAPYVVLAASAISLVPKGPLGTIASITGNVGITAAQTSITGFSLITDHYGLTTSEYVHGAIYAADIPATPDARNAMASLDVAYADAAGRTMCAADEPTHMFTGELGGKTLTPGLYKSTSGYAITGELTLDAQMRVDAVFIFQMAETLESAVGSKVILINGAQAKNVFWQVGSSAVLGVGSTLVGTMMADQSITVNTGATVTGRVLARIAAVTMDAPTISLPAAGTE